MPYDYSYGIVTFPGLLLGNKMRAQLIKYASSRVMREFLSGKLSSGAASEARSFLPGMERLTAGLNKGSDNIIAQKGYTSRNMDTLSDVVRNTAAGKTPMQLLQGDINQRPLQKAMFERMTGPHTNPQTREIVLKPGMLAPKKATPAQTAYSDAITKRHEADEARFDFDPAARTGMTDKSRAAQMWSNYEELPGGVLRDRVQIATGSHNSPKVLLEESRNVALGDRVTQDFWKDLRGVGNRGREAELLGNVGVAYGAAAPATRSARLRANKDLWRQANTSKFPKRSGFIYHQDNPALEGKLGSAEQQRAIELLVREERDNLLGRFKKKLPWNRD